MQHDDRVTPHVDVRRVGPTGWSAVREIRLAALRDTPDWFWATYDEEVDKNESWWRERIDMGAWFLAYMDGRPVGIAAGVREPWLEENARGLVSMWVEPGARGRGIGGKLVEAVEEWARAEGAKELQLQVTQNNDTARRLYENCGFQPTGRAEPLPRDPALIEHEMRLLL